MIFNDNFFTCFARLQLLKIFAKLLHKFDISCFRPKCFV